MAKTVSALLNVAAKEVGYNRYNDPEQGTKYGRWYAKLTNSPYFGTTGVPYCAMFVSWCLYQLGITCTGCPTASCTSGLLNSARRAGKLKKTGKAGDLVLFNWNGGGYYAAEADHVGIVKSYGSSVDKTIEGNVSGCVKECSRDHYYIVGYITPNFEAEPKPKEDEVYGFKTIKKGDKGNEVMLLQSALNIRQNSDFMLDGIFGPYTESELKRWQKSKGIGQDGICGPVTWPTVLGK